MEVERCAFYKLSCSKITPDFLSVAAACFKQMQQNVIMENALT